MRLQKILAEAGLGSRRACETFIREGRVSVDGATVSKLGATADPDMQKIVVDGRTLRFPKKQYFLLNKPVGYLCTSKADRTQRPLAIDLVPSETRLFCVGRLDVDSKGALILTNDGTLSNYVTHPRYHVTKTYRVRVSGKVEPQALNQLKKGVWLAEGKTGPMDVKIVRTTRKDTLLRMVVKEGKNRIIRRALARLGLKVLELERTRIGAIALGRLKPGEWRALKTVEIRKLTSTS
jgi:23S rRNA pseudouridine2605 synthase